MPCGDNEEFAIVTPDLFNLTGLAFGLGLLGFIEPCTIGAHMLFLNSQCDRPMRRRIGALSAFMLARLLVMGGFGGVTVMLGQRMIGVQTNVWLVFGGIYMVIGIVFLSGAGRRLLQRIRIAPDGWRVTRNPWVQGIAFGLNIRKRPLTATLRERAKARILGARGSGVSEQLRKPGFGRHM
jgi:cytochrome c-type biogenesis protein